MNHFTYSKQAPKSFHCNSIDEHDLAQAELAQYINEQAQTVVPEEYTSVEITFHDHEIYTNDQLIARINHDDKDFVTQRWLVIINNKKEFRANTWAKCYRYICTHHKDGSLPVQEQETPATSTGNEIMVQIANECENLGLELLDDGIYRGDEKLGEAGCTNGTWWFTRTDDAKQQQICCNSASDAVWLVSRAELSEDADFLNEYLQYRPLEQMPSVELKHLLDSAELVTA